MSEIETAIALISSIGDEYCENQAYIFPEYDPSECDATALCKRLGIPFTDDLMIRYPANRTFKPLTHKAIAQEERALGATLPSDYKTLLETFGEFHLPGDESLCFKVPAAAARSTQQNWTQQLPLSALAISSYHKTSDGNCIGFIRNGPNFGDELFEFDHELVYQGEDPKLWSRKLADSLSAFLVGYLRRKP